MTNSTTPKSEVIENKTTRETFNLNITELKAQDSYYCVDGMHLIAIRNIRIENIHLTPSIQVDYKWYEFATPFGTKATSSGTATESLQAVLKKYKCQ